jgi:hypothetical protein
MEPEPQQTADEDLATALKEMRQCRHGYDKAEDYYCADVPEIFASARMRRAMRRSGINYQLNLARIVVESVVDRLEVSAITSDDESGPNDLIQQVMEANKFKLQGTNTLRKACEFGDAYVIVWPKENATAPYRPEDIAIWYQDPRTVRVFYSDDNPLEVEFAAKKWEENSRTRIDLYYADRIESYVSKKNTKGKQAADFEPTTGTNRDDSDADEDDDNPAHITKHDFGQVPVFHFKTTADQYGTPEHKDFFPVTDIIHKLAISHMAGVDYQSFPQRYALMDADSDTSEAARLDEGLYSFEMQQGGTTEDYGTEGRSQFKADPGSVWMAPGIKGFGQFDAADPANFTDPMEFYVRMGATITNTPLHYFDPTGDAPSGESLRTAEAPFIKKVENRKLSFGDTWREVFQFVLQLLGNDKAKVVVHWKPSSSSDDEYSWQVAQLQQASGVPVEQTLLERGYTAVQVAEWEENGQQGLPQRVSLLLQVSQAMANFTTATAGGLIGADQVNGLVLKLLGQAVDDDSTNPDTGAGEPTDKPLATDRAA